MSKFIIKLTMMLTAVGALSLLTLPLPAAADRDDPGHAYGQHVQTKGHAYGHYKDHDNRGRAYSYGRHMDRDDRRHIDRDDRRHRDRDDRRRHDRDDRH